MKQNLLFPVLHPSSSIDTIVRNGVTRIRSAKDIWVTDDHGHRLIDGTAGLWCANLGHGRPEIAKALYEACLSLDYFHTFGGFSNESQEKLAKRLVAMAPGQLRHVFFGSSGSDANDTILKIIWHYNNLKGRTNKKQVVARWGAYHGTSISTASLTGLKGFHNQFDLPISGVKHTDYPFFYRFANPGESEEDFSKRLIEAFKNLVMEEGADTIAAFFGEPMLGAGGVIPPPKGYWEGIQEVCRENDILLVADEVVSGFGRTGHLFGCGTFGIEPDLMATAKGLTSGVFPMSAAFMTEEIWGVLHGGSKELGGFFHGYTCSGHPVGAEVANTVLDVLEQEKLVENADDVGRYLMSSLTQAIGDHPLVGEVRGAGLVMAVQLIQDKADKVFFDPAQKIPAAIAAAAYELGLIIRPLPSVGALALSPPLVLTREMADVIVTRVQSAIENGLAEIPVS